jgi:DNA-binding MarR family transcriptional regulator
MSDKALIRLDNQLCFQLYACSRAMTKAYQPMLKALELTYPQYLVLMVLWEWDDKAPEEPSVKALGERLLLDSGTLTPLLKRMESSGLLTRERDAEDERRVLVRITKAAKNLEKKAAAWVAEGYESMAIDDKGVASLRDDLKHLLSVLTQP